MVNWIKALRERSNITQDELAARLEIEGFSVSRSTIAAWESDRHEPPLSNPMFRRALSRATRMNVRTLLKVAGYEVDEITGSLYAERAANLIDLMSEDRKQLALRILEELAKP